ncbi:MAG: hypothetical protein M1816_002756 [Peltula sp. TS41687]|nr:MAG: hypothetical protein M1816_002756 [Peltula sp. TS41687]
MTAADTSKRQNAAGAGLQLFSQRLKGTWLGPESHMGALLGMQKGDRTAEGGTVRSVTSTIKRNGAPQQLKRGKSAFVSSRTKRSRRSALDRPIAPWTTGDRSRKRFAPLPVLPAALKADDMSSVLVGQLPRLRVKGFMQLRARDQPGLVLG